MARITLKRIANNLGLSIGAVSAALTPNSSTKVSAKTAARVRACAKKLNYRPSLSGRSMRSQFFKQVGILVECDLDVRVRSMPIVVMPALFGLNSFLMANDWQLNIIEDDGKRTEEQPLPRYLREHFLDGVIVCSSSEERDKVLQRDLKRYSIPTVFLNASAKYNSVSIDDRSGAAMATRHLLEFGHRKIVFVGTASSHSSLSERLKGYEKAMAAAGLRSRVYLMKKGTLEESQVYERRIGYVHDVGRQFVDEVYSKKRPTAIVCYDDRVAMILVGALHQAGIDVPGEVSIVGYNDMPFVDILPSPLTTIRSDFYAMGQLGGKMLLDLIKNKKKRVLSPILKPELVVRQSSRRV